MERGGEDAAWEPSELPAGGAGRQGVGRGSGKYSRLGAGRRTCSERMEVKVAHVCALQLPKTLNQTLARLVDIVLDVGCLCGCCDVVSVALFLPYLSLWC